MTRARLLPTLTSGVVACLLAGMASAPASASGHHDPAPNARTMLSKAHSAERAAAPAAGASTSPSSPSPSSSAGSAQPQDDPGGQVDDDEAESVQLRAEYQQSITAAPATSAPVPALLAAHSAAQRLPVVGGTWHATTDKPFLNDPLDRGMNYGTGWGLVTGRLTSLTSAGDAVYAGSAGGGVWRTTDDGAHWRAVNAGLPRLAIGTLATDPRDGSVWVGTGEGNNSADSQYGVGVYRLARGSSTWTKVGGSELYGAGSYRIRWIRGSVYIATTLGLYRRSAAAPRSSRWRAVLQPAGRTVYPPSSSVTDVMAVPGTHESRILAVVGWAGYSTPPATQSNGFYVGSGAAGSFARISPTGDIDAANIGRTTFSSSHGWLYAVVTDPATGDLRGQGAFLSKTGPAGPWVRIADVDKLAASGSALGDSSSGYYPGAQADYNQNVVADPSNPRHVYLQLEEVFESTDAGTTWNAVGPYWNFDISCDPANTTPYACPRTTHPDQHAGFIRAGQFWVGSDGGAWRRPTTAHSRGHWTNLNATLHTTQAYSVDVGRTGAGSLAYWSGLQDNGESYTRSTLARVEQAFTGDGGDTIVDPRDGDKAVEEYVYLDMFRTTDGGRTLTEISPSCLSATDPPAVCDPNPRFIAPIEKDVRNPDHWVAGGQYVWDDTKSWSTVCNGTDGCDWRKVYDLGAGHQTTALGVSGTTTYAGWCGGCNPPTFDRGIATNYGGTWHELSTAGLPNRYVTSIAVDPTDAAHVYLSFGSYSRQWIPTAGTGHVFESRDAGTSWTDVSGNIPDAPVYRVVLRGSRLLASTEVGAFVARTGSTHHAWAQLGRGLPNTTAWDMVTAPGGRVVVGTHGRGDWQVALP